MLWGTDNLKNEGGPIAQALALIGVRPRFDSYGRLAGATLIELEELGPTAHRRHRHPLRHLRDLLPLQIKLLAEASFMAAAADEPVERNFVRKHTLAHMAETGCDLETAALRVFGNAEGAYGLQRQPSDRKQRLGRRRRIGRDLLPAQGFRLWARRSRQRAARNF